MDKNKWFSGYFKEGIIFLGIGFWWMLCWIGIQVVISFTSLDGFYIDLIGLLGVIGYTFFTVVALWNFIRDAISRFSWGKSGK